VPNSSSKRPRSVWPRAIDAAVDRPSPEIEGGQDRHDKHQGETRSEEDDEADEGSPEGKEGGLEDSFRRADVPSGWIEVRGSPASDKRRDSDPRPDHARRDSIFARIVHMPNRSSKRPRDLNALAAAIVGEATGEENPERQEPEKNPAAVELGRRGGLKGGPARATKLSATKRSQIAKKAAEARWSHSE